MNRVVAPEELRSTALALAGKIAEASRRVVGLGKVAFYKQLDLSQSDAYAFTKEVMTKNAQDRDAREGIAAFVDKRQPKWPD